MTSRVLTIGKPNMLNSRIPTMKQNRNVYGRILMAIYILWKFGLTIKNLCRFEHVYFHIDIYIPYLNHIEI